MRKVLTGLLILTGIALAGIYLLFPASYQINVALEYKNGSALVAYRVLGSDSLWEKALSNGSSISDSGVFYKGRHYRIIRSDFSGVALNVQSKNGNWPSQLLVSKIANNSILLSWNTSISSGNSPVDRIKLLSEKNLLEADQMEMLFNLRRLMEQPALMYGFDIVNGNMTDSVLLTTSFSSPARPTIAEIYQKIDAMYIYAAANGAVATNSPMFYMRPGDDNIGFKVQVGLPVNKQLKSKGDISIKRMVLGKNLTTEVSGPQSNIARAYAAMRNYVNDYALSMPAIPYELLLTDRRKTDSSEWKTKIVFPVY